MPSIGSVGRPEVYPHWRGPRKVLQTEALARPNLENPLKRRERGSVCKPDNKQGSVADKDGD